MRGILGMLFAYLCKNEKRLLMVDNLTIMLEKFSGNFENCEIVKVFENMRV